MCSEEYKCAHIVIKQHSVTTHSWLDCTLIQVSYLHVEEVYLDYPIRYDRCSITCLHARGISDLPMGNGPGLQHTLPSRVSALEAASAGIAGVILVLTVLVVVAVAVRQSSHDLSEGGADQHWSQVG